MRRASLGFRRVGTGVPATSLAAGATGADLTLTSTLSVQGASTLVGDIAAGNLTMASGKVFLCDPGTGAAPGFRFSTHTSNTGIDGATVDQVRVMRGGGTQISFGATGILGTTAQFGGARTTATLAIDAETVQTADYAVTAFDAIVIMNGASLTATLPASPSSGQTIFFRNLDGATALTIARNGKTIDGAAANITIAASTGAVLQYNGTGWHRLV